MFIVGASLVLSYFFLWFCSVEILHASDTVARVSKIPIPYPNREFGNIFFLYARNQKEKAYACMQFFLPNTLNHCPVLNGDCAFQSMCSLSNLVARFDFFSRTAGRANMELIVKLTKITFY